MSGNSTTYDDKDTASLRDVESGYGSGESNDSPQPEVLFTKTHLKHINQQLSKLSPDEILQWCLISLPSLYQTTALGPSGLVILDKLSKISGPLSSRIDLIFLDTLHHFSETLDLANRVRKTYPKFHMHIYKPEGCETAEEFATKHGEKLWESNEELYDWVAKVEPAQRSYAELQVKAVITGRRSTQGGKRSELDIVEIDDTGMIKVNPLANWTFDQVNTYIKENDVPSNELLQRGYKSVGDWHSTQPVAAGEDERSGRWKGRNKTECGIHNKKSRYAQFLMDQERKRTLQQEGMEQTIEQLNQTSISV
ncbi:putative Phosphoadenosine phosphosulfate reductase [Pseudovirgaria hyperparasitica]|uniref:phosphoadenylyl-sulfate reductase (thioredoxin) n=1 Tax=Pseudovirgaria hyperparasitica TaxID=470096 RepID=A0A6A6W4F2_9PEZI|nr:putative Phosphoadenosine phosphosulfate reductase [Pseudovirgaria hyperparasitica]KAF2757435.1 putative Phosphoadenosine phosphosulfate reductase [Pseudovirgaria hyperparasitica]